MFYPMLWKLYKKTIQEGKNEFIIRSGQGVEMGGRFV